MSAFNDLIKRAQQAPARIALPEATDARVLQAAVQAHADGRCRPVLVGRRAEIIAKAKDLSLSVDDIEIADIDHAEQQAILTKALFERRKHKGMNEQQAKDALADTLTYACTMVNTGAADGCVAGAVYATADVTRTALQVVGAAKGASFVSSFFLMMMKHDFQPLKDIAVFADCALVIDPDAGQLAEIAMQTAQSSEALLGATPVVAMLSFSTGASAKHPEVSKVQEATRLAKQAFADKNTRWKVIGDVQLDAAVIPEILSKKAPDLADELNRTTGSGPGPGPIASNQGSNQTCETTLPNILVFPNLNAGNIGYKLCERFGGCDAVGPVLQGLARPVNDLSRGCKAEDIEKILAITSLQASI